MPFVLPEIVIRRLIEDGIRQLRGNRAAFDDLFSQFAQEELGSDYGQRYVDQIWNWFSTTKIPVIQAWSLNAQRIPCISCHLANETEDETKAAMNDYAGTFDAIAETNTGVFTVMIDIGVHANKGGDHVLWMYYIVAYILMKYKPVARRFGLQLGTFQASDYSKDAAKMGNNIWTRWIRFRCTTQNFWGADALSDVDSINVEPAIGLPNASDIAVSEDVNIDDVDTTANEGLEAGRIGDDDDSDNVNI